MPNTPVIIPMSNRVGFITAAHGISGLPQTPISTVGKRIIRIPRISAKIERDRIVSNLRLINKRTPTANNKMPSPISARAVHKHFIGMFLPLGSWIDLPLEAHVKKDGTTIRTTAKTNSTIAIAFISNPPL
jgi:hypothetical protein